MSRDRCRPRRVRLQIARLRIRMNQLNNWYAFGSLWFKNLDIGTTTPPTLPIAELEIPVASYRPCKINRRSL